MTLQCIFTQDELETMNNSELLFEYRTIIQEIEYYKANLKNIDTMMKLVSYRNLISRVIIERMDK